MLKFMVTTRSGRLVLSSLHFNDAVRALREQDNAGRDHNIYLADEKILDHSDTYLDLSKAIGLVSDEGLIAPFDGSDFIPAEYVPDDTVSGLSTEADYKDLFSEPCPECSGFGDEDPDSSEVSICPMCASGSTLGDAVLLAVHRAGRMEPSNPLVRLVAHFLRGDQITVNPRALESTLRKQI
tara:strand:+ start:730 stop:1275 length:546 start_codon:yes stop_codon:yes gene_type:complete